MRKIHFANGEFYHIYNRGVDKRNIFSNRQDFDRFMQGMEEFNSVEPIGSIYENRFKKQKNTFNNESKLVDIICYCLNPNHYHLILEQVYEDGISKYMKSLGGGYAKYFNERNKRNGVLFQGPFKAVHINTNEYLLYLSVYVNLNKQVHKLGHPVSKFNSWGEYIGDISGKGNICKKNIILDQFNDISEYKRFAQDSLSNILSRKKELEIANLLID